MAQNLVLDPVKKDYVLTLTGSPIPSDRAEESCYFALAIPQGNWLYGDASQGSKLYTLENVKRTASIEQQISSFAMDALSRQVISTGQISDARVQNVQATRTGTANNVEVIPVQSQVSNSFDFVGV